MTSLRLLLAWLALCTFVLGGCATEPQLPPILPGTIARLVVDGPNAFLNNQPAQTGTYVRDGDNVSTGPKTSVIVKLNEGGDIQLDENTDPLFKQGACLFMKILRGKVVIKGIKCQEFEDGLRMAGVARSFVHIMSLQDESRVTVIAGEVEMRSPRPALLHADEEYLVTLDGAAQVLKLTPEQSRARIDWTRNYFQPRAGLSPAGAAAIGVAIGVGVKLLGGDRDRRDGQEPPPNPETESPPQPEAPRPPEPQPPQPPEPEPPQPPEPDPPEPPEPEPEPAPEPPPPPPRFEPKQPAPSPEELKRPPSSLPDPVPSPVPQSPPESTRPPVIQPVPGQTDQRIPEVKKQEEQIVH